MGETRAQTLARHNAEMQFAIEQHEIRMRTMRERHLSELALCIDQAGRSDTCRGAVTFDQSVLPGTPRKKQGAQ